MPQRTKINRFGSAKEERENWASNGLPDPRSSGGEDWQEADELPVRRVKSEEE